MHERRVSRLKQVAMAVAGAGALAIGLSGPTLAAPGGEPGAKHGSCGLGLTLAKLAIADPTSPGATEFARFPPSDAGCTGQP